MYEYSATVRQVVDGDTLHLTIDLGLDIAVNVTVRLYGINSPEKNTPEGVTARAFAEEWLHDKPRVLVVTHKDDKEKYGRYLAQVFDVDRTVCLNDLLVTSGHAVPYFGGKR